MYNKFIYALHGVVERIDEKKVFIYRNCIEKQNFINFIDRLPHEANSLLETLTVGGIALTIDDSTNASLNAALIARERGHHVSLFVNPYNIITGEAYWFHKISFLLDQTSKKSILYDQTNFELKTTSDKKIFRNAVKTKFRKTNNEAFYLKEIENIQNILDVESIKLPEFLLPPTLNALQKAAALGVAIENHFWSHFDVTYSSDEEFRYSIKKTHRWIQDNLGQQSNFFAAPFGESIPLNMNGFKDIFAFYLTSDSRFFNGFIGESIFNRYGLNNNRIIKNNHERYLPYSY